MLFGYLTLFTALIISLSAAVYSILGLTAIFAAAFWPIVIMGGSLEVGKIVTTLWLHKYWDRAEIQYKLYLCSAVAVLMFLTSMGVFGFLSKAHTDQSLVSGDSGAKVAIYDEKIKISRDNIDMNRKALKQMDEAVDQVMGRSSDEKGADKAVAIRRGQAAERSRLLKEIEAEQKKITTLSEERAPLAAENRKIEAEVGPIKYIAAMVYGDNPDTNVLEKAVRWVIILIVIVFDPLALTLLLAATKSIEWEHGVDLFNLDKKKRKKEEEEQEEVDSFFELAKKRARFWDKQPKYEPDDGALTDEQIKQIEDHLNNPEINQEVQDMFAGKYSNDNLEPVFEREEIPLEEEEPVVQQRSEPHAPGWMFPKPTGDVTSPVHFGKTVEEPVVEPVVETPRPQGVELTPEQVEMIRKLNPSFDPTRHAVEKIEEPIVEVVQPVIQQVEEDPLLNLSKQIYAAGHPDEDLSSHHEAHAKGEIDKLPWHHEDHVENLPISDGERKKLREQLSLQADNVPPVSGNVTGFGINFPQSPTKGDLFLRVDQLPSQLYKFNGNQWISIDKNITDTYVYDEKYIDHLIDKIGTGEYDLDLLSDAEREQIAQRLNDTESK